MGASAGYGQAVHSGKCAMHKLGIQVLPSPGMMAIMDAKDTLCKVTLLSIRSEDMLADYTADMSLRLASRRGRLFSCTASSRTEARHARASGLPSGNLAAHAFHPL